MNEKERNPSIVKAVEDSNKHSMERELMVHLKKVFHSNGSYSARKFQQSLGSYLAN
jgi:hypothetical protein